MVNQQGVSLEQLSEKQAVLLVFLRPFGCIFCMEAMADLSKQRKQLEADGTLICCVHMADPAVAESYFNDYGLDGIDHISDLGCSYYEAFGLLKGNFNQLYGLKIWLRTAQIAIQDLRRLRMKQIGDGFQMPGVFLVSNGKILESFRHKSTSDRPLYQDIIARGKAKLASTTSGK